MNEVLLHTIIDKLKNLDEAIQQIKSQMPQVPDYSGQLKGVSVALDQLKAGVTALPQQLKFPTVAVHTLLQHLQVNNDLLKRPPRQDVQHHHHIKAGVLVSGALFLLLAVSGMWLYNTHSRLQDYKAGDIKYRHLKLRMGKSLHSLLSATDSLYKANSAVFRNSVVTEEEDRQHRAELLQEAEQRETEARKLRNKAKRKH
jgi:uncharacterized phage infection (PIP) family protein YhgE